MQRLSLREYQAVASMAQLLSQFLPGSGNRNWKGHVNFQSITQKLGLAEFWIAGSKVPAITNLLKRTLEERRGQFEGLIMEVYRSGTVYRLKRGEPITPEEIRELKALLLDVEFKFPELWDSELDRDVKERSREKLDKVMKEDMITPTGENQKSAALRKLQEEFVRFCQEPNRQQAGTQLECILNELLRVNGIAARKPFRVTGEQIDGSFELDSEIYLVEAKWEKSALGQEQLLVFREKISGKSNFTRGMFIAINDVTAVAKDAITRGKQPIFFVINGYDLMMVLSGAIDLKVFLRQRVRLLCEEGAVFMPYNDLYSGSRGSVA